MRYINLLSAWLVLLLLPGCGGDDEPKPDGKEGQLALLAHTWQAATVTLDGTDISSEYEAFILTLQRGNVNTYSVSNPPPLDAWKTAGTWTVHDELPNTLVRDTGTDEVVMAYTVTETTLRLTFYFSGPGYQHRVARAQGEWVMEFTKR